MPLSRSWDENLDPSRPSGSENNTIIDPKVVEHQRLSAIFFLTSDQRMLPEAQVLAIIMAVPSTL